MPADLPSPQRTTEPEQIRQLLHDLRSPLTAMSTWTQMLRQTQLDAKTQQQGLEALALSVEEMTRILDEQGAKLK